MCDGASLMAKSAENESPACLDQCNDPIDRINAGGSAPQIGVKPVRLSDIRRVSVHDNEAAEHKEEIHSGMAKTEAIAERDVAKILRKRKPARRVIEDHHERRDRTSGLNTRQFPTAPGAVGRRRFGRCRCSLGDCNFIVTVGRSCAVEFSWQITNHRLCIFKSRTQVKHPAHNGRSSISSRAEAASLYCRGDVAYLSATASGGSQDGRFRSG